MEDVIDFPHWWELEFICNFRNLSSYLEGSVLLWCYFGREIAWESKVYSFQPDFGSNGKGCETGLLVIQESCTLHCASWAVLLASWINESCCSKEGTLVFLVGWCICRVYPMRRLNGVFFVVAEGQEFFVY